MVTEERYAGEIGYQVVPWARGAGHRTAAARLVRDWALDELGLERVEISADVDNIGSQRVALAAGMPARASARLPHGARRAPRQVSSRSPVGPARARSSRCPDRG